MSKKSSIQKNKKKIKCFQSFLSKRKILKEKVMNKSISADERFMLQLKLSALPRNSAKNRIRNRCELTGRPRGNYRKFGLCRIKFRELSSFGMIPGVIKSSW